MHNLQSYLSVNWVDWGWLVSWNWVDWFVDWLWSRSVVGSSFIDDLSDVARVSISGVISYNLGSAVWKKYTILARGGISITLFVLTEVCSTVVVLNSIFISIDWWGISISRSFSVSWSWVVWSWWTSSKGNGQEGRECNKSLSI